MQRPKTEKYTANVLRIFIDNLQLNVKLIEIIKINNMLCMNF